MSDLVLLIDYNKGTMQKWEEKLRQKHHELKIGNAKSSIKKYSDGKQKGCGSSPTHNITNSKCSPTPISKILEIFKLEKYGSLLNRHGFPGRLAIKGHSLNLDTMLKEVETKDK